MGESTASAPAAAAPEAAVKQSVRQAESAVPAVEATPASDPATPASAATDAHSARRRPRRATRQTSEIVVHTPSSAVVLTRDPLDEAVIALARELPPAPAPETEEFAKLRRRARALEMDLARRDRALADASARVATLEQTLADRDERHAVLERDRVELRRSLIHTTATLGLRDDELARLRSELARADEEREEHDRQLADAEVLQRALREEHEALRRVNAEIETDQALRRSAEHELTRLRNALASLHETSTRRDAEIAELRRLLDDEQSAIASREDELTRLRSALQHARQSIQEGQGERVRLARLAHSRDGEIDALRVAMARARALLDESTSRECVPTNIAAETPVAALVAATAASEPWFEPACDSVASEPAPPAEVATPAPDEASDSAAHSDSVAAQLLARFAETTAEPFDDAQGVTLARSLVRRRATAEIEEEGVTPPRRHPRPERLALSAEGDPDDGLASLAVPAQDAASDRESEFPAEPGPETLIALAPDAEPRRTRGSLWRRVAQRMGRARDQRASELVPLAAGATRLRLLSPARSATHDLALALGGPDLPAFAHWASTHVRPMLEACAVESPDALYLDPLVARCVAARGSIVRVLSLGASSGELEVRIAAMARAEGVQNFRIECLNVDPDRLIPGRERAAERHVGEHVVFSRRTIEQGLADGSFDLVFAVDVLHRLRGLEATLDRLVDTLASDGMLITVERIGRNHHARWPEARELAERIWRLVPETHRLDARTGVVVESFADPVPADPDDGVRAEDVLPQLLRRFHAETFVAFGNVIEAFVNERFGASIDPEREEDRRFLDRLAEIDHARIDAGALRPTRMLATWRSVPVARTRCWRNWTPELCLRRGGNPA